MTVPDDGELVGTWSAMDVPAGAEDLLEWSASEGWLVLLLPFPGLLVLGSVSGGC